jgi:hypothetical protein
MSHEPGAPRSLFPAPIALLTRSECEAIAKKVLSFATADETRVTISSATDGNMRFAVNQASTSGDNYDNVITVRSAFGKRSASSTTNSRDDDSLKAVVARAEALAKLAPDDPEALPELGPQTYTESPGWSESTASLDAAQGRESRVHRFSRDQRRGVCRREQQRFVRLSTPDRCRAHHDGAHPRRHGQRLGRRVDE